MACLPDDAKGGSLMLDVAIKGTLGETVFDMAFTASDGVTAIFGPSGAGKTTVANAIAGLWRPDKGRIALGDKVWFDSNAGIWVPPHKRKIGYVFQDARLFPHMSVAQNLRYGGSHDAARLIDLLDLAHLLTRRPSGLSGGEKQRVAIARALMRNPDLIIMDEPMAALDEPRKAEVLPYLEHLRDMSAVPIIYVSHAMAEVSRLAASLVLVKDGSVAGFGPINEVLSNPDNADLLAGRDLGAVIAARVDGHDHATNITTLAFSGGALHLAGISGSIGQELRLRIPAQDVILSLNMPRGMSALNVLTVDITSVSAAGKGTALIGLQAGAASLLAQITEHSAKTMHLEAGQQVYAIVKATAVAPT
jgi:molybdate transport system ATP-binding protein